MNLESGACCSPLLKYRENIYSQNGEDGILRELLRHLDIKTGWFCEFGAWDGKLLSNTFALAEQGWHGVEIKADEERFRDLQRTCEIFPNESLLAIHSLIAHDDASRTLDALLATTPMPVDFAVLSIDIDSLDYQIWQSLKNYKPKIVIIEVDSSIPPPEVKIATSDSPESSFWATVELGRRKGYTAVCHTGNVIFVRSDLIPKLDLPRWVAKDPARLFIYKWVPVTSVKILSRKVIELLVGL